LEKEPLDAPTPAISDMGDAATPGIDGDEEEGEDDEEGEGDIDEELAAELDQALGDEDEAARYGGDEEEDEEDDESEDDEDEDEDDELVQARKLLNEEIRDLEAAVAKKNNEIASSANPLIRVWPFYIFWRSLTMHGRNDSRMH
jgi:transcription initiation factor TFIID subunit 7